MPESHRLVSARDLRLEYRRRRGWGGEEQRILALNGIDLEIVTGEAVGITGVSGCGKTSLVRVLAGLERGFTGQLKIRASVQMVVQDPGRSLNPRFTGYEVVEEPMLIARIAGRDSRTAGLLRKVGLDPNDAGRRSGEFSGGERARLAIARALAAMPEGSPGLIAFDESFSSLDDTTQDQLLRLLAGLREAQQLTCVFVSHDIHILRRVATRVVFLHEGRVVTPDHAAARELMACAGMF